ncbi:MAG TPA: hypothetical protein VG940_11405 [Gemmatimonadales bacterium]|nr:hypothetical protein [Gemmatimonadales bacterium]
MKHNTVALAFAAALLATGPLNAQSVNRDPSSGDYRITYQVSGQEFTAVVPSADRISPVIELLAATAVSGGWTYEFRLSNLANPPATPGRGILTVIFPCERNDQSLNSDVGQPYSWRLRVYPVDDGTGSCQFEAGLRGILDPGASVSGLHIRSGLLPGIVSIDAIGVSDGGSAPTEGDTPDTVVRLMAYASSKGVTFDAVMPARSPAGLNDPGNGIVAVYADLGYACGRAAWVDQRGVCRSLQAKLEAASASLARGQSGAARNQLTAFRLELDAQRGKHVNEQAYLLLSLIADHTLSRLQ